MGKGNLARDATSGLCLTVPPHKSAVLQACGGQPGGGGGGGTSTGEGQWFVWASVNAGESRLDVRARAEAIMATRGKAAAETAKTAASGSLETLEPERKTRLRTTDPYKLASLESSDFRCIRVRLHQVCAL